MNKRLASLDILRGADLFLLLVIGPVLHQLLRLFPSWEFLARQTEHVSWEGFVLWDLIMPLFLFMSGATIPFSMARYREGIRPGKDFYLKLLRRVFLLFLIGWAVQGNLLRWSWHLWHPFANTLQAIAVGYAVTALLFVHLDRKGCIIAGILLFAAYWAAFALTHMNLDPQDNIAMLIDKVVLGSHRDGVRWADDGSWTYNPGYQYTWILSSLNFAVTVLLGCLAGDILRNSRKSPAARAGILALGGILLLGAGLALSPLFPIIKKIWSSSMTLYAGGLSFLLLALTYWLVDVKGISGGPGWLRSFGMNSIVAYTVGELIDFSSVSRSLLYGFSSWSAYPVLIALANAAILTALLHLLYRRHLFLKA